MALAEAIFDLTYLVLVVGLGIRLLLSKKEGAGLFGAMAVLLGLGDAFHLIPRVFAHLTPGGSALSWGKFVTGITMTIFYLLFYFYYRSLTGDRDEKKKWTVFLLAALRIFLILLPQNNWGGEESYTMGILRNIPFAILGLLLILWTYKKRQTPGLEKMSLFIFLSFLFYLPVVLWVRKIPALGALMIPKTLAYVGIVVLGFRHFIKDFTRETFLDTSIIYLLMGLAAGIFYRETTKYFAYSGSGRLALVHGHALALGFLALLVFFLCVKDWEPENLKRLKKPFYIYNTGLVMTLVTMVVYGVFQVVGRGQASISLQALAGISGLGHLLLSLGLVVSLVRIKEGMEKGPGRVGLN